MRGWHRFVLAGAIALALAPLPALADEPVASAAEVARTKALQSFQSDLVSVLALRATAKPLLGAALLARPLTQETKATDFHALINRAVAADGAGPAEQWVRLADCDAKADTCPNAAALRKLEQQAPDNAAVWLLKLSVDSRDLKAKAAHEDLAKAAAAKIYDDYAGTSMQALASVADALPPPPPTQNASGPIGVQALIVLGNARLQPRPVLPVTAKLCEEADKKAAIKTDCLKLGKLLQWGSSPLSRSLGLHLLETLGDSAEQAAAQQHRRDLLWQVQNYSQLALRAQTEPAVAQQLVAAAKHGGTEMSQVIAVLRASGVSTTAPGSWQPAPPPDAAPAESAPAPASSAPPASASIADPAAASSTAPSP